MLINRTWEALVCCSLKRSKGVETRCFITTSKRAKRNMDALKQWKTIPLYGQDEVFGRKFKLRELYLSACPLLLCARAKFNMLMKVAINSNLKSIRLRIF